MNLKSKVHLVAQKAAAETALAAELTRWEQRGLDAAAIQRTASVRQAKALVRKINQQLASIAAQEEHLAEKARVKAEKALARESGDEAAPAKPPAEQAPKKAKKEKKEKEQ
ncbi:MAG TPA: hypothetical protein VK997_09565 [Deferrisomatales bacterium]|nr:hypothetical protein [Deferrisomatales bacterium]